MDPDMTTLPDWLQVILKIGVPGAIAVFLVYRLAGGFDVVDVRLKSIEAQHADVAGKTAHIEEAIDRSALTSERVLLVLRQICAQNAATKAERSDCFQ